MLAIPSRKGITSQTLLKIENWRENYCPIKEQNSRVKRRYITFTSVVSKWIPLAENVSSKKHSCTCAACNIRLDGTYDRFIGTPGQFFKFTDKFTKQNGDSWNEL